jgi:hypothetical protein
MVIFSGIALAQDNLTKVKVGIVDKAGNKTSTLKLRDRVKSGDELSIYVQPLQKSYVYVLCVDNKEVSLLNTSKKFLVEKDKLMVLPSESESYKTDDLSPKMSIMVICDKAPIKEIENIFKGKQSVTKAQWVAVEKSIAGKTRSGIKDNSGKPITIAGNVRGVNADIVAQLPAFSAEGKLIRKYDIEVKK